MWSNISSSAIFHDLHDSRFGAVNNTEIDIFLELSHFFSDPAELAI